MTLCLHNTLSGTREEFSPRTAEKAGMYICGVTPYDDVHLGHARAYVTFDIVRRHLVRRGFAVTHAQNFTDVDDKIIARAALQQTSPRELADRYIADYFAQMDRLGILRADHYPRVTGYIEPIIGFIARLMERGAAYQAPAGVYYAVRRFPGYGRLSKRNLDDMRSGARVDVDETKEDPLDFALWKRAKPGEPPEVCWDSPWGQGRPGWHIECSVMAGEIFGDTLDIHGGGLDLVFPHHENEIAQSEAATGRPLARYWMHNGFVTVNQEKMSKSLGNFFTLRNIFARFEPRVVRYFLLSQHYRTPLDFSDDKLEAARAALEGIDDTLSMLDQALTATSGRAQGSASPAPAIAEIRADDALDDDFNTERALAALHELKNTTRAAIATAGSGWLSSCRASLTGILEGRLGIALPPGRSIPAEITALARERALARAARNWNEADRLRAVIADKGYKIMDNPDGSPLIIPPGATR